jgi:hypothetical protein
MVSREFGAALVPFRAVFDGVVIEPVKNHEQVIEAMMSIANKDGYFYPPTVQTYNFNLKTGKRGRRIKNTERPASTYPLPVTHSIEIENPVSTTLINFEDAGLLIHLLAFLLGTRLQFSEWRIEGRVPTKSNQNISISEKVAAHFLESVYREWREWSEENRNRFVNILYVYTRSKSLEWEWDAFMWQYTTFDALYKLYSNISGKKTAHHSERFDLVCNAFGIRLESDLINKICTARNDLVHEAIWAGAHVPLGHAVSQDDYYLQFHLERFNARLICAIAGYKNNFVSTPWWVMGSFLFDKA